MKVKDIKSQQTIKRNSSTASGGEVYFPPIIQRIILDNEISLVLASDPPTFESKNTTYKPEFFNNQPFKRWDT